MSGSGRLVWFFFLLLAVVLSGGCDCGDDDSSTSSGQADDDSDDDATDDDADDDITPDDDSSLDDDTISTDDDADDDQSPHISDENALYPFSGDPRFFIDPPFALENGGWIRQIDYGQPGHDRTALTISDDGYATIVTTRGRQLVLYHHEPETPFDEWKEERIAQMAGGADLAVDSTGALHVAYSDLWDKSIVYATDRTGQWEFETVDVLGELSYDYSLMNWNEVSIALDSFDNPHLTYSDPTDWDLKYAIRDEKGWQVENIPMEGDIGRSPDLALDNQGFAHIVFGNVPSMSAEVLFYAHNDSGSWEISAIDWPAIPGSLAIDEYGYLNIAYLRVKYSTNEYYQYFTSSEDGFTVKTPVDINGGGNHSLTVDESGRRHLAYGYSYGTYEAYELFYAVSTDAEWTIETVTSDIATDYPKYLSIALDDQERPNISYDNQDLYFARRDNEGWSVVKPTPWTTELSYPALAVDNDGAIHLAFVEHDELIYATNKVGYWTTETIDDELPHNSYADIDMAVSDNGIVHLVERVVFEEEDVTALIYYNKENDAWVLENISSEWTRAWDFALEVGSDDNPRVLAALGDGTSSSLYLLTKSGGEWSKELIDNNFDRPFSFKLDANDVPHVTYRSYRASVGKLSFVLIYAFQSAKSWVKDVVDNTEEEVYSNDLNFDNVGNPIIACSSSNRQMVKIWYKEDSHWIKEIIADSYYTLSINLYYAEDETPIIVTYNMSDLGVGYFAKDNNQWKYYTVENSGIPLLASAQYYDRSLYISYLAEEAGWISRFPVQ